MEIEIDYTVKIQLDSPKLSSILAKIPDVLTSMINQIIRAVLLSFSERELAHRKSSFTCEKCGSTDRWHWKTRNAKHTSLLTEFGKLEFPDLQIQCGCCGKRKVIAREMLGVEKRARIPLQTVRKLGLLGALATFRVSAKIASLFGIKLNKMTIWRAVQKVGKEIGFSLDPDEPGIGEADGTGISINGILKRGKEIKVFLQMKAAGGCRLAGVTIDKYNAGWNKLFKPLRHQFKAFEKFLLITDGDDSILKGIGKNVKVIFQRCVWHIPHQFKWYRWKDGIKLKDPIWITAMVNLIDICDVSRLRLDDESCLAEMLKQKRARLEMLIDDCRTRGWNTSAKYLENAKADLFRSVENRLTGKTQSHAERVMRTTKMRTGVGKWNVSSALNCIKIRLAYYYNEWDA